MKFQYLKEFLDEWLQQDLAWEMRLKDFRKFQMNEIVSPLLTQKEFEKLKEKFGEGFKPSICQVTSRRYLYHSEEKYRLLLKVKELSEFIDHLKNDVMDVGFEALKRTPPLHPLRVLSMINAEGCPTIRAGALDFNNQQHRSEEGYPLILVKIEPDLLSLKAVKEFSELHRWNMKVIPCSDRSSNAKKSVCLYIPNMKTLCAFYKDVLKIKKELKGERDDTYVAMPKIPINQKGL